MTLVEVVSVLALLVRPLAVVVSFPVLLVRLLPALVSPLVAVVRLLAPVVALLAMADRELVVDVRASGGGGQIAWRRSFNLAGATRSGMRRSALKREATLSRLLSETLGERRDFVRVLEWNFEEPPFFLECEYGGCDLERWAEQGGRLHKLPLERRLKLFARVAEAVAAAHSAGVLHKDLKPSNVLIDDADGDIRPRLTDFGNARLLDPHTLGAHGITALGFTETQGSESLSGTLFYLAPEILKGQPPTTRSDIYALGVMLYQIVVGDLRRPMTARWDADVEDELLRGDIAEAADGNPAQRLSDARDLALRVCSLDQRHAELRARKAAAERAAQAERTASRALARRPWMIAAGASLSLGLALTAFLYLRARTAQEQSAQQAAAAHETLAFVTDDVLGQADPYNAAGGRSVTLIEALRQAEGAVDKRLGHSPEARARVHLTLGKAYQNLGEDKRSREQLAAGLREAQSIQPAPVELLHQIRILQGDGAINEEKPEQAWILYSAAYDDDHAHFGIGNSLTLEARMSQGWARHRQGQELEAYTISDEALRAAEALRPRDDLLIDDIHWDLAEIDSGLARWADAQRHIEAAMAHTEAAFGKDSSRLLWQHCTVAYKFEISGAEFESVPRWSKGDP